MLRSSEVTWLRSLLWNTHTISRRWALERTDHLVRNPAVAKQVRRAVSDGADEIRRIQRAVSPTG